LAFTRQNKQGNQNMPLSLWSQLANHHAYLTQLPINSPHHYNSLPVN